MVVIDNLKLLKYNGFAGKQKNSMDGRMAVYRAILPQYGNTLLLHPDNERIILKRLSQNLDDH